MSASRRRALLRAAHVGGFAVLLAWGGCAGDSDDTSRPGASDPDASRLVAWRLEPEGGGSRPLVLGIYDRELSTPCRFVPVGDGSLRCLPEAAQVAPSPDLFADARCERPLFSWTSDGLDGPGIGAPPEFVAVASGPRCAPVYAARRAEVFSADRTVFAREPGGGCVAYSAEGSAFALGDKSWLAAGEPVPDSRFAEGRRVATAPPPGQRLSDEVIESASGGPFLVGIHDARWQRGCDLVGRDEGDAQCWPPFADTRWGRFYLFTDQTCGPRLAAYDADDESCEGPALVYAEGALHELGERWSVAPYSSYAVEEPTCTTGPESPRPPRTFLVGAALDADALARLQLRPQGAGQVRFIGPEADDGRPFDLPTERLLTPLGPSVWLAGRPALFERAAESPCAPFRVPDGTIRCLPPGDLVPLSDIYFSDDRCSQPLAWCTECAGKQVVVPAPSADPFGAASAVHELGPQFTGQAYSTGFSNDHLCRPVEAAQISGGELRTMAAPIDWGRYPRLTEWRGASPVVSVTSSPAK